MTKLLSLMIMTFSLASCAFIPTQRPNIEQGNVITPEMTQRLHTGMSESSVKEVMGTPMLVNTFNDNRIDYVYTYQSGHGNREIKEKYITLTFNRGILRNIQGNLYSQAMMS